MIAAAVLAGFVSPYDPLGTDYAKMLQAPSSLHWFGTDSFGRDVFTRILYGSRTALWIGFASSFLGATLGAHHRGSQRLFRRQDRSRAPTFHGSAFVVSIDHFGPGGSFVAGLRNDERHFRHHGSHGAAVRSGRAQQRPHFA